MLNFVVTLLPAILSALIAVVSLILVFIRLRYDKSVEETGANSEQSKALKTAGDALTKVYNMLPGLITFSETMNSDKPGAVKKEFVINYIKNTFAMLNVELDDVALTAISGAIDDIVTATKTIHIGMSK